MSERGVIRKLLHDIKPARRQLALGMLLYVPVTVLSVIKPAIIGYTVQYPRSPSGQFTHLVLCGFHVGGGSTCRV